MDVETTLCMYSVSVIVQLVYMEIWPFYIPSPQEAPQPMLLCGSLRPPITVKIPSGT